MKFKDQEIGKKTQEIHFKIFKKQNTANPLDLTLRNPTPRTESRNNDWSTYPPSEIAGPKKGNQSLLGGVCLAGVR